jgi:hypothetical protein
MDFIKNCLGELAGLVVDDGRLALSIAAVVACAAAVSRMGLLEPLGAGVVLLAGCVVSLLANVARAPRPAPPQQRDAGEPA